MENGKKRKRALVTRQSSPRRILIALRAKNGAKAHIPFPSLLLTGEILNFRN